MTRLAELVRTSNQVAGTSSRLGKVAALAGLLKRLAPGEIPVALPYLSGEIRQGSLALGHAALQRGRGTPAAVPALTLDDLDRIFAELKAVRGKGAGARRAALVSRLFAAATAEEQDFLRRLLVGELRQGALEGMMLEAVAQASGIAAAQVRRAAMLAGALAPVAAAALEGGVAALERFSVQPMQPVLPMLAQSAEDPEAALRELGTALFEWKIDGARVQVHKAAGAVHVFTRNLNDVSARVPELVEAVQRAPAQSLILDGEAIALRADGRPYPFQVTMSRFGSQQDADALRAERPLSVYFFDCLYRDGQSLIDRPLRERRGALDEVFERAAVTPAIVARDASEARAFYEEALGRGHEGVMAKALESPYEAGRRGSAWLKVKRARTLDLVVLAAEWGHGRRRGWLSNLHLGARDPGSGAFVMLGKTFKGLTDALLQWQTRELLAREVRRDEWAVYVRPELVVEIAFNDLQQSTQYPGGLALRFARVKGYRMDKRAQDADTIDTVRRIYEQSVA
ncbi:MAG TPA: ATP-dependent DNA ligase [Burkholderiales bacterium]|nr:ATP-dependent DNA ligase [Burkholderiales bacterium]